MGDWKPVEGKITLHGLGFVVVQLGGNQRLHVWHPDLPRRTCHAASQVHDHRFAFESHVLVGQLKNTLYERDPHGPSTHQVYEHEGERTAKGNRPWIKKPATRIVERMAEFVFAGRSYTMIPHDLHATTAMGDGRVATLMRKTYEGTQGARSLVTLGVEPDVDFDRYQLEEAELWAYVVDVLGGYGLTAGLPSATVELW